MRTRASRGRRSLLLACCALAVALATACSVTIGTDPNAYPFPSDEVFEVAPGTALSVSNSYREPTRVKLENRVYCDLQHLTETTRAIVERELVAKGAVLRDEASKKIVLRVINPIWTRGMWSVRASLGLEARYGDQAVTIIGEYQTGGNAMRAFNGAILRATTALLKTPELKAYLAAP